MRPSPIGQPVLVDAYFQANLHEGHGFLDCRGKVIDAFGDPFKSYMETSEGGVSAIHLFDPLSSSQPLTELKLSAAMVWLHYRGNISTVTLRQETARIVLDACKIIGVTQLNRQGLRVYYLLSTDDALSAVAILRAGLAPPEPSWDELGEIQSLATNVRIGTSSFVVNVQIQPVQRSRVKIQIEGPQAQAFPEDDESPEFGVMVDADVFDERRSDFPDPKPHLNRAVEFLDDRLLPRVAKLLSRGAK